MTRQNVLPSAICTASAPRIGIFRGSMAGLCAPLSTLRRNPRGLLRMTRGRCGSLLLHRKRLALSTPCRSPGASQMNPDGSLSFFCAIDEGMVLTAAQPRNPIGAMHDLFAETRDEIGDVSIYIGFECVLRRL